MTDERLTADFHLSEFIRSQTADRRGLDNTPTATAMGNIRNFLAPGMQDVRDLINAPIHVSSGYRSPIVNAAIGGAQRSQHIDGLACDFTAPFFGTPKDIARVIAASKIKFDQLIMEGSWVHISFAPVPRLQVMTARFSNGVARYIPGLV